MRANLLTLLGCVFLTGCLNAAAVSSDDGGAPGGNQPSGPATPTPPAPGTQAPPAPPVPPPTPAAYVRGSIAPPYQLTPRNEYGRIQQNNVTMADTDFQSNAVTVSSSQKMDEIGALADLVGGARNLIPSQEDRQRANFIPFRGNPTDVKFLSVNNVANVYVPLGGDVMTPGNEVAVVQNNQLITRVKVGVRPLRLAVHPAGLIFVCNQYSNFISVIDPTTNQLLTKGGKPVEIATEFMCADMAFVPSGQVQDPDHQFLYVANRWRHSVLKYTANIVRDPLSNKPVDVISSTDGSNKPLAEVFNVGNNPWRLAVSEQQDQVFVANNKGGEVARIDVRSDTAGARISINAPSADVVNIQDLLFVPTLMPDRGFLASDDAHPQQVVSPPFTVQGLDGQPHVAHPGALFDNTKSYNFEDLRNGIYQLDFRLGTIPVTNQSATNVYYTDDVSSESNFQTQQKILAGSIPTTVVRNAAGTAIFVAMGGSDCVQQFTVNTGSRPFTLTKNKVFKTQHRPFGLALNEKANQLYVSDWGSERLEVFDLNTGNQIAAVDLGYAQPEYPATNIEKGEFFFINTAWSNNARKSCASCHFDELDTDGVGFGNGATAPTEPHQVKPNHNLATTDAYFWNGSFGDGNYTSVAFAAQTRDNCELVEFGLIEGPGSNAQTRVGDPNNKFTLGAAQDAQCRPVDAGPAALANQATIDQIKKQELAVRDGIIKQVTGLDTVTLSRVIDFYDVSELRLPANPLHQLFQANRLASDVAAEITQGKQVFSTAGCAICHNPADTRHPFADGLNHGSQADWISRFINTYTTDARITAILGAAGFPQTFLQAQVSSVNDHEVNATLDPIDFFIPFCFDVTNCFEFDDPLQVRGDVTEETRRLNLLVTVNLADPDRQFFPGNVRGAPQINTPSLRGVWTQANLLHHGLGHTIKESLLAPGHPALGPTEVGWAVDKNGQFDVHGATKGLSASDVKALVRYVENIE
jgi:YVTN family beta-propeller protein